MRPTRDFDCGYYRHFLKSHPVISALNSVTTGIRQGKNISFADFGTLSCLLPPLPEQRAIADFLDRETGKIDALVAKKERLIELLQEKRTALITHAVTKGLDPTVPMKITQSDFFPKTPSTWQATRVRYLCRKVADGPHFSPKYVDDGVMFISARNVKVDGWSFADAKYVTEEDYVEFSKRVVPRRGDVLFTKGGTTGVARVVDFDDRFQVWVHIAVLKVRLDRANPFFLAYALNGRACYEQSQLYTRGATNNDLGLTRLINIELSLPPLEEQVRIVTRLDALTSTIDRLVRRVTEAIEALHELRASLISSAVLGKIDVRN
ncbi:MAG: restriction endonuclease subunit S [Candidatus Eisenbacteria bacterium]